MPYPYIIEMICDWWTFSWIKGDRSIVEEILKMIRTSVWRITHA